MMGRGVGKSDQHQPFGASIGGCELLAGHIYFGVRDCTLIIAARSLRPENRFMVTNETPEEKRLQHASFVIHATRGVVRDQRTRRRVMVIVVIAALLLMASGATVLQGPLNPHERPGWFIFFWLICAWLTITAILIAVFDLLIVTSSARKAERAMRDQVERESSLHPPDH
jgi:hypothetical protein